MNQGHEPVVPIDICDKDDAWHIAMRKCIAALITCDEAHFLPCWKDSPGARLEHQLAKELQIPIVQILGYWACSPVTKNDILI